MTGPDHLWLNLDYANQQRPAASFVTKGPLAGPPYTGYTLTDLAQAMVAAAYEDAAEKSGGWIRGMTNALHNVFVHAGYDAFANRIQQILDSMAVDVPVKIRASTPDDAKAALERVKQEARNEALREAAQSAFDCQNPFLAPSARIAVRDSILAIIEKDATDG